MPTIEHRRGRKGDGYRVKVAISSKPIITKTFKSRDDAVAWGAITEAKIRSGDLSPYQERETGKAPRPSYAVFYDPESLLSHDQIIAGAKEFSDVPGVYFLIRCGVVVYVGQSLRARARVEQHRRNRDFDSFYILRTAKENLLAEEAKYIHKLNPIENRSAGSFIFPRMKIAKPSDGELPKKRRGVARSGAEARGI